jgi:uncharacterized protein
MGTNRADGSVREAVSEVAGSRESVSVPGARCFSVRAAAGEQMLAARVHVADSLWSRFRGLMGRSGLDEGEGLWLPGDSSIHMCFMRFAIDAVFLAPARDGDDDAWTVVAIRPSLRPWRGVVWPVRGATGCLEVAAGSAAAAGLRAGDVVRFEPPAA